MLETPDRLHIDKKDRDLYNALDQEDILKFKGGTRSRKEQFFFALSIGYQNKIRSIIDNKEGWFNSRDLNIEDETILNAIAVGETKTAEIILNKSEVFEIAQEYAHAGIRILCDKIKSTPIGIFEAKLENELQDIISGLFI